MPHEIRDSTHIKNSGVSIYVMEPELINSPDHETLARYLNGTASAAEVAQVDHWTASGVDAAQELEQLRTAWSVPVDLQPQGDLPAFLQRWQQAVDREEYPTVPPMAARTIRRHETPRRSFVTRWGIGLATAAVILAGGWFGLVPQWQASSSSHIASDAPSTHHTTLGERARITLPDGSSVALAPETRITLSEGFGVPGRERVVQLDGEAVFTVLHSQQSPFIVRAGSASVQVLGTTFNVRYYRDDPDVRVAVAEGRVGIGNGTTLGAGDVGKVPEHGAPFVAHTSDVTRYFGWTHGRIAFRDVPMSEALSELSRWYGIRITTIDRRLLQDSVTTSLDNASQREMLDVLALTLNARVTELNNTFTLTAK